MARRSASPARRSKGHDDSYEKYGESSRRRDRGDDNYGARERRRREYDSESSRYGYGERERERERDKDRSRYDRARDEDRDRDKDRRKPSRRSYSPPSRASRPRSKSGSRSPSPISKKAKPNFGASGLLAAATNTVKGSDGTSTVLKYNEPPEARKPTLGWRLYVFKGKEEPELLHINRQSAYLVGRDRLVADIALDHPSCSKQHAAFQHRSIQERDEFGSSKAVIKPFIIDLESTNGTHVNAERIPAARFYELKAGDVIKFGLSTKEYVLLHDDAS
ncbi:hypothetical protein ONZ45_g10159 [Pleurotus djamor]|nr:hypothetical protein ONZ45_g10159 [Pleurotus djamor]